jgi:hypothetical protein
MSTMTSLWDEAEPVIRERAYRTLDNDPMILFEGDGGPGGGVEIYLARLFGLDGEIVEDGVRLREPLSVIRLPIAPRLTLADEPEPRLLRTADYVQQSGFVVVPLAAEYAPPGVELLPDFTFRVMYLRYRRRL